MQTIGPEPFDQSALAALPMTQADSQVRERLRTAVARLDDAETRGDATELIEALLPVARCYTSMGVYLAAEEALRQALRAARRCGSIELMVSVLTDLAQAACQHALDLKDHDPTSSRVKRDRARDCSFEASALIHRHTQADWASPALVTVSEVLSRCGDHDDAAAMRLRAASWSTGR